MTADQDPEIDPQDGAAALVGAPESPEESARERRLAEMFAPLMRSDEPRSEIDDAAREQRLAALFAGGSSAAPAAREAKPDFSWKPDPVSSPGSASASARQPAIAAGSPTEPPHFAPDAAPPAPALREGLPEREPEDAVLPLAGAALAASAFPSAARADVPAVADAEAEDPVAWAGGDVPAVADTEREDPVAWRGGDAPAVADAEAEDPVAWRGGDAPAVADAEAEDPVAWPGGDAPAVEDAEAEDPVAWLEHLVEERTDTPEKAPLGTWLATASASETTAPPADVAAAAEPTRVLPQAATGPPMSPIPAQRRGIRAWSSRVRWSVAVSIVLLIGVVAGAFAIAQNIAASNLAAQQIAAAIDGLEAAEESATDPQSVLDAGVGEYEDTVEIARATADGAAPPLAAIVGMAAQPALDASNAALAALNAQLAESALGELPEPYQRGDVDTSDIDEVEAATRTAENHEELVTTATRDVRAAQAALQEKLDALRAAQVALGASLPETAVIIVGENRRALQSFRDAVIAASVAVPAAQEAGGSGDAEILAYAAAVTALRNDQTRAQSGVRQVTPPSTRTSPAPAPEPAPEPQPEPAPSPEPAPPPVVPSPDPTAPAP